MIGYVTLGTNDLDKAAEYYDALFGSVGVGRILETEQFVAWGPNMTQPGLSLTKPYDGKPATVGNGVMVALAFDAPEKVDTLLSGGAPRYSL